MTLFKSIWYVTVTASTVGYGDLSPVSFMGKVTGIVIIVVGVEHVYLRDMYACI